MNNFLLASSNASSIVWLVILIVLVVVMLVLPSVNQKKRVQAYQEMQNRLKAGDKVQTIGGIVGKINRIKEKDGVKTILIETGDKNNKIVIEFDINAIAGVVEGLNNTQNTTEQAKEEAEEQTADTEQNDEVDEAIKMSLKKEECAEKPASKKKNSKKN